MNPLFILAALSGQIPMTAYGIYEQEQQKKTAIAQAKLEAELARVKSSEEAAIKTRKFTRDLSSQLAISALRSVGGGSIARQFAAESMHTQSQDEATWARKQRIIDLKEKFAVSDIKTQAFVNEAGMIKSLISSGASTMNLSGGGIGGMPLG